MNNYIDNNPWAGLSSYEDPEKAKREGRKPKLFCGRDEESHNVAQLIASNILVTLYGKSGTGKTSLLNAGVFPRLRQKRYLPISIRLSMDAMDISFQQCIIRQLSQTLGIANGQQQTVNVVPMSTDEQQPDYLWSFFARTRFTGSENRTLFPVIVFDQFEEIFRNRRNEAEVLLRQIAYLMDESHALSPRLVDDMPYKYDFNFRFVVSIREDDLYRLEDSIDNNYLAELKRCRYRLHSLSEEGARDAILIPGEGLFAEEEQIDIVAAIIEKSKNEDGSNSTNIISLLCSRIFVDYQKTKADHITFSLVEDFIKGNPFERFYNEATLGFSNKEKSYIEDHLVDSTGRRNSIPESDFLLHVPKGQKLLEGDNHILQRASTSSDGGNVRVELIHDSFCNPLVGQKEKRYRERRMRWLASAISFALFSFGIVTFILYQMYKVKQANWRMMENQARAVVEKAESLFESGDIALCKLLVLNILPEDISKPNRPYIPKAEKILRLSSQYDDAILRGHTSKVFSVSFAPDGKIISAAGDSTIRIWATTGNCIKVLRGHKGRVYCVQYSPCGDYLASSSQDGTIRVWDKGGDCVKVMKGHHGFVYSVLFSPNGKFLASRSSDGDIRVWDTSTWNCVHILKGHFDSMVFGPQSNLYTVGEGKISLWDIAKGICIDEFKCVLNLSDLSLSPDGKLLAFHTNYYYIYSLKERKCVGKIDGYSQTSTLSYSPDGKYIISSAWDKTIRFYHANTGELCRVIDVNTSHGSPYISISSDGNKMIFASNDREIRVMTLTEKKLNSLVVPIHKEGIKAEVSFSNDGKKMLSTFNNSTICVIDATTGDVSSIKEFHADIRSLTYSPDNNQVAFLSKKDSTIYILDDKLEKCIRKMKVGYKPQSLNYRQDGKRIIVCCDSILQEWDFEMNKWRKLIKAEVNSFHSASFSNDGKKIVLTEFGPIVKLINAATGKCIKCFEGHSDVVVSAFFSYDDSYIITSSLDHTVRIWEISTGKCLRTILDDKGEYGVGPIVCFMRQNNRVVVAGDYTISVYDINNGERVAEYVVANKSKNDRIFFVSMSPDGRRIISSSLNDIKVWEYKPLQELIDETREYFKSRYLTLEERRKFYLE